MNNALRAGLPVSVTRTTSRRPSLDGGPIAPPHDSQLQSFGGSTAVAVPRTPPHVSGCGCSCDNDRSICQRLLHSSVMAPLSLLHSPPGFILLTAESITSIKNTIMNTPIFLINGLSSDSFRKMFTRVFVVINLYTRIIKFGEIYPLEKSGEMLNTEWLISNHVTNNNWPTKFHQTAKKIVGWHEVVRHQAASRPAAYAVGEWFPFYILGSVSIPGQARTYVIGSSAGYPGSVSGGM